MKLDRTDKETIAGLAVLALLLIGLLGVVLSFAGQISGGGIP